MLYKHNMSIEVELDAIFKALGDTRRRRILDLLKKGPRTTGDLCDQLSELDRCTVMQHLKVLEKAGLIFVRREGRTRWNHLNPAPMRKAFRRWIGVHAVDPAEALKKLDNR